MGRERKGSEGKERVGGGVGIAISSFLRMDAPRFEHPHPLAPNTGDVTVKSDPGPKCLNALRHQCQSPKCLMRVRSACLGAEVSGNQRRCSRVAGC